MHHPEQLHQVDLVVSPSTRSDFSMLNGAHLHINKQACSGRVCTQSDRLKWQWIDVSDAFSACGHTMAMLAELAIQS